MSFLENTVRKAVKKVVENTVEDITLYAGDEYFQDVMSVDAVLNRSTARHKLFIKKKSLSRGFYVLDEDNNRKYQVKPSLVSLGGTTIRLFDLGNKELGSVHADKHHKNFSIYVGHEKVGNITRKPSIKLDLTIDFNGWKVKGNLLQYKFSIYDKKDRPIMMIHNAKAEVSETYVIEYNDPSYEMMGILLMMAIEATHEAKP